MQIIQVFNFHPVVLDSGPRSGGLSIQKNGLHENGRIEAYKIGDRNRLLVLTSTLVQSIQTDCTNIAVLCMVLVRTINLVHFV